MSLLQLKNIMYCAIGLGIVLAFSGCRAAAARNSGFLHRYDQLKESDRVAFNSVWVQDGIDFRNYSCVTIAEINTDYLLKMSWWNSFSRTIESAQSTPEAEVKKLAELFYNGLHEELEKDEHPPKLCVDQKNEGIQVEIAITEVVPTKVWLNSIAFMLLGWFDHGSTAMEGKIRDLSSGEIIARWKDRQHGQATLISAADFSWYAHSRRTINYWSEMISKLLHASPDDNVEGRTTVTLKPW